jgi:hypothetical protein
MSHVAFELQSKTCCKPARSQQSPRLSEVELGRRFKVASGCLATASPVDSFWDSERPTCPVAQGIGVKEPVRRHKYISRVTDKSLMRGDGRLVERSRSYKSLPR